MRVELDPRQIGRALTLPSSSWNTPLTEKIRRIEAGHKDERQSRQPGDGMLASQEGGLWDEASGLGGRNGAMKQAG